MISITAVFALLCAANVIAARDTLDCIETAKRFGSINFISALDESGLTETIRNLSTVTIFAPTNDAFLRLPNKYRDQYRNDSNAYRLALRNHVLKGTEVMFDDLHDEKTYVTLADNATVRANIYNRTATETFKTINGARINNAIRNVLCGDSVVMHFVDQVITSISTVDLQTSILDNVNFSNFTSVYRKASSTAQKQLSQPEGNTVFVPNDKAFGKLPVGMMDRILNSSTSDLADQVLTTHIIDSNVWFSQAFIDKLPLKSHNGTVLVLAYDDKQNKYTINGANFVDVDVAATNGVYHIVDNVLFKTNSLKFDADFEIL